MADPDETLEMEKRGFLHFTSSSGLTLSLRIRVWVVEFKVQELLEAAHIFILSSDKWLNTTWLIGFLNLKKKQDLTSIISLQQSFWNEIMIFCANSET